MSAQAGTGAVIADHGTAPGRRGPRRRIAWLLTVVILAALVLLGLSKLDLHQVGHALARVSPAWVGLGAAMMIGAFLARAESWYGAIRAALPHQPIGRPVVTRVLLIGMAGSTVAPGRLGEAARAWLIARRTGGAREALATVIGTLLSQTLLNILALTILAAIALAGSSIPGAHAEAIVVVVMLPVALVGLLVFGPRLLGVTSLRLGPFDRLANWLRRQLGEVRRGLTVFRSPRSAIHSIGFQLSGWALQLGTCYTVLVALRLDHRAGFAAAAAILLAVNITAVLPLTPSNVGVFQAACIAVLAPFGVSASTGLAYGLVLQAIEIACALALGLPSLLHEGMSVAELRRVRL